ncbi:hypothetical protein BEN47_06815 [Hymenobacter lapidarius]|uniref:Uncharacterized protein n=2 Tax=Hymenobacter lapidarius TaxID=1908237 RepID=A0A1G1TFF5_9BACT|nr:hypothetical protein BEN47_06815 [Hymenobacter lapidarius]
MAGPAFAQTAPPDADLSVSIAAAQKQHAAAFTAHSQLLNGPQYLDYSKRYYVSTGHQFFGVPDKQPGSVTYTNQRLFDNLELQYDLVYDQVVLSVPNSALTLRLINEEMQEFTLNNHRFVRLLADSASAGVIRTGYYEMLLDGTVQVLAKRSKRLQEQVAQHNINVRFTASDKLFMRKDGRYYPVASKGAALRLLADRGKDLQKYLQEHKLKFSKASREASLMQLAGYYAGLVSR